MAIDLKLIDKMLVDYKSPEEIIGKDGLLKQFTKALLERAMQVEMNMHLGYEKHDPKGNNTGNSRNGSSSKTLQGEFGELQLETPRDRNGSFEPKIIAKGQTRFEGFDAKIISMYARGMSVRQIRRNDFIPAEFVTGRMRHAVGRSLSRKAQLVLSRVPTAADFPKLDDKTQRIVHVFVSPKLTVNLWFNQNQIRSSLVLPGVFSSNPTFQQFSQVVLWP